MLLAASVLIVACTTSAFSEFAPPATLEAWAPIALHNDGLAVAAWAHPGIATGTRIHVYLHGDGRAFLSSRRVARNPTPRDSLAAKLAAADPLPSVFLARPCYFRGNVRDNCGYIFWTSDRFGSMVIASVADALNQLATLYPSRPITLFGYSGGGVVALLAAQQVEAVDRVVTIAAPLNTHLWTQLHGYTALADGSNPATVHDWPAGLQQVHLVGKRDRNVPPQIAASYIESTANNASLHQLDTFDHQCCWVEHWPELLETIADIFSHAPKPP